MRRARLDASGIGEKREGKKRERKKEEKEKKGEREERAGLNP